MPDYVEKGYSSEFEFGEQDGEAVPVGADSNQNGITNPNTDGVRAENLIGGDIIDGLTLARDGWIRGGADGYDSGEGFFLGFRTPQGDYAFFIGSSSGDKLTYNTTDNALTITGALNAGSINIPDPDTTAESFHVAADADTWWGATTTNFNNNPKNARAYVLKDGNAFFQNVEVNGVLQTVTFEKNVVSAVGGQLLVANADVLATDMTELDSSTVTIKGDTTFAVNEVIRLKDGINDEWMRVTNAASAPTYTVTRDLAGAYSANNNPAWKEGTAVVSFGLSDGVSTYSGGYLQLFGSGTNAPKYSVFKRTGTAYNAVTEYATLGNLNGRIDYVADEYGVAIGTSSDGYMTFDPTNGLRISGAASVNGSQLLFNDIFGDGSDGDATIAVNTSLARDMFYDDLTVNNGVTLNTNGYRLFVRGTLTNNGTIGAPGGNGGDGGDGGDGTAVLGSATRGTPGTAGAAGTSYSTGSVSGTVAPSAGAQGGEGTASNNNNNLNNNTNGLNSSAGNNVTKSIPQANGTQGGIGGQGGDAINDVGTATSLGTSTGTVGAAGTHSGTILNIPRTISGAYVLHDFIPSLAPLSAGATGSGGAGAGAGGALTTGSGGTRRSASGGGGGGGGAGGAGGVSPIYARLMVNNGTITVRGGNGGNGGNAGASAAFSNSTSGAYAGGSGGGGGGCGGPGGALILVYSSLTGSGTIVTSGGTGGAGGTGSAKAFAGTGVTGALTEDGTNGANGADGNNGVSILLQV